MTPKMSALVTIMLMLLMLTWYLQMQRRFMDCVETAAFPGQATEEIDRLLHMVCSQVPRVAMHPHLFIIGCSWWWSDWGRTEVLYLCCPLNMHPKSVLPT